MRSQICGIKIVLLNDAKEAFFILKKRDTSLFTTLEHGKKFMKGKRNCNKEVSPMLDAVSLEISSSTSFDPSGPSYMFKATWH